MKENTIFSLTSMIYAFYKLTMSNSCFVVYTHNLANLHIHTYNNSFNEYIIFLSHNLPHLYLLYYKRIIIIAHPQHVGVEYNNYDNNCLSEWCNGMSYKESKKVDPFSNP